MRLFLRLPSVLSSIGLLAAVGCGSGGEDPNDFGSAAVRLGDVVAAEVNGSPVYLSEVQREGVAQGLLNPSEPLTSSSPQFEQLLEEMIDQRVLALEAVSRGVDESDEARRRLLVSRERILGNVLVESVVEAAVNEANIRRMYEEQVKLVALGEEVRLSHIVVATREEAEEIVTLLNSGVAFSSLALDRSLDDSSRLDGGDLGYVTPDRLAEPLARVAFGTPIGRTADPFETEFGWHILMVEDRRDEEPPTYEEMRPRIVQFLTFDEIQRLVNELRADAQVRHLMGPGADAALDVSGATPTAPSLRPSDSTLAVPTEP